jgi:hypothetical protein
MTAMAQGMSRTAGNLESRIKSVLPADKEHLVDDAESVLYRYLNMPLSFSMGYDIDKAKNILKNLKDFPAYVDGKVGIPRLGSSSHNSAGVAEPLFEVSKASCV